MLEKKRSANNLISEQLDDHEKRLLMIEENVRNLNPKLQVQVEQNFNS